MTPSITLEPVLQQDMPAFRKRLQAAFTHAAQAEFPDFAGTIPPDRDIDESLAAPGAEALQIVCGDTFVGGALISGDGKDMLLDFLFIDTDHQSQHLGLHAWRAIESRYPHAVRWELLTPYHEKRNIHFYVNRCGFCITEYFNPHHANAAYPEDEAADYPGEDGGLFRFEKVIDPKAHIE